MAIGGVPALACETFVKGVKGNEIEIRPLRILPAILDLIVDQPSIFISSLPHGGRMC